MRDRRAYHKSYAGLNLAEGSRDTNSSPEKNGRCCSSCNHKHGLNAKFCSGCGAYFPGGETPQIFTQMKNLNRRRKAYATIATILICAGLPVANIIAGICDKFLQLPNKKNILFYIIMSSGVSVIAGIMMFMSKSLRYVKCPGCGGLIPHKIFKNDRMRFCPHCGVRNQPGASLTTRHLMRGDDRPNCAFCGGRIKADDHYCSECGARLTDSETMNDEQLQTPRKLFIAQIIQLTSAIFMLIIFLILTIALFIKLYDWPWLSILISSAVCIGLIVLIHKKAPYVKERHELLHNRMRCPSCDTNHAEYVKQLPPYKTFDYCPRCGGHVAE